MNSKQVSYEAYKELSIDGSWIGFDQSEGCEYFCTPIGARILGWDNGIHYCFMDGFGDTVFCVNPESCCDYYVYPIAKDFTDFLRLLLAVNHTNVIQQVIWWNRQMYKDFITDPNEVAYACSPEVKGTLEIIADHFGLTPMEEPFDYIKELQKGFPYEEISFSNEYYDILGLERPDCSQLEAMEAIWTVEIHAERKR